MAPGLTDTLLPPAAGRHAASSDADTQPYLLLRLGDEVYALPGTTIREIARWRAPTPVPGAPPVLPGIINQRGAIVPVVHPHTLFGLVESPPNRATRYVIMQHDEVALALFVDAVIDFVDLAATALEPLPAALDPQRARFLRALARHDDQPLAVVEPAALIATLRTGA